MLDNKFIIVNYKDIKINQYTIDEFGNIFSYVVNRYLCTKYDKDGYKIIGLANNDGKQRFYRVATLVAYHFLGKPPHNINDITINHIDGNKINNHHSNLEWMERSENSSIRLNTLKGELNKTSVLTEEQVLNVCELIKQNKSLNEIAKQFNTKKSTISNIKRRKSWTHLTKDMDFLTVKKQKNNEESNKQRQEILELFLQGDKAGEIIKLGYPRSVVYRVKKQFNSTGTK